MSEDQSLVLDAFDEMIDLYRREGTWTQHADARGADSMEVDAFSPAAVRWCITGALSKVIALDPRKAAALDVLRDFLSKREGKESYLRWWNDAPGRTQEQVLELVRGAREELQAPRGGWAARGGWSNLGFQARKWHYFPSGAPGTKSLCGKWSIWLSYRLQHGTAQGPDDCKACGRKLQTEIRRTP